MSQTFLYSFVAPLVILDDAPVAHAVEATLGLMVTLNGQWCRALGRLVLPQGRANEIMEAVEAALANVSIGDPFEATTMMGPRQGISCAAWG